MYSAALTIVLCAVSANINNSPSLFADLNDTTAIPLKHLAMKKPAQKTINALSFII